MTRDRAYELAMKACQSVWNEKTCKEIQQALEQKPTSEDKSVVDAISRAEAIRIASGYCHPSNIAKELEKLPSVNAEQTGRWIPANEPPEDMAYVWLTCISKVDDREPWVCEGFYNPYYKGSKYSKWGNIPMLNWGEAEVIAWMEQIWPEPYKSEIPTD